MFSAFETVGRPSPSSPRAASTIARAMGCWCESSTAPACRRTSDRNQPATGVTDVTHIWPVVIVPVLSSNSTSTVRVCSRISGPRINMPARAPRLVPTNSAIGVARPSAHGQAMMSTATPVENAFSVDVPNNSQARVVNAESATTTGTKIADTRSARRCTGAVPD